MKHFKHASETLAKTREKHLNTIATHTQHADKNTCNIYVKHMQYPDKHTCNIRLKKKTDETLGTDLCHPDHPYETLTHTSEISETYLCNIRFQGNGRAR
jgi:hypothetical protein